MSIVKSDFFDNFLCFSDSLIFEIKTYTYSLYKDVEILPYKKLSFKDIAHLKASCYWLSQYELEQEALPEKVKHCLETNFHLRQAQAWELAGKVLFIQSRNENELALYQQLGSLGWFEEQIDCYHDLLGKISYSFDYFCLKELGDVYIHLCRYNLASTTFEELLQLARKEKNTLLEAQALEGLGLCHNYLGAHKTGLELCQQSLTVLKEIQDNSPQTLALRQQQAKTLVTASFIAVYLRKYRQAGRYAQEALMIARQINDPTTEWYALARLATCYSQRGQRKKAFQYIEQQYQRRHQIKDLRQINVMLTCYCIITCSLRKFDLTINALQEAIQLQKTIGDTNRQCHLICMLGYVYLWRNEYSNAIFHYQECIILAKRYRYQGHYAMALIQLSYLHSGLGNLAYAQKLAKRGLAISRHFEGFATQAYSLATLGLVEFHKGKFLSFILLTIKSLILAAPITSGDSKIILVLLTKRLFMSPFHSV